MKVLFAVSSESIVDSIIKVYQKEYNEIISSKNEYYFKAVTAELKRNQSYDRIVISEDLEPYANNNYDAIDKFIFEKFDEISDEAVNSDGRDIPIIVISSERREKSDDLLSKFFSIGIYDALIGQDRKIEDVCKLLKKPRTKKEAKAYYKIDQGEYEKEDENNVSEAEIQNILAYYKKNGKNEEKYVEIFDSIAEQYNEQQLKIIIKFLPIEIKAVLEEKSYKYQSIMTYKTSEIEKSNTKKNKNTNEKEKNALNVEKIVSKNTKKIQGPVIIPTAIKSNNVKKVMIEEQNDEPKDEKEKEKIIEKDVEEKINSEDFEQPVKRGRGRPKKEKNEVVDKPKRGRGRPKKEKNVATEEQEEKINEHKNEEDKEVLKKRLPGFEEDEDDDLEEGLPGFEEDEDLEEGLPGFEEDENLEEGLPGFEEDEDDNLEEGLPGFEEDEDDNLEEGLPGFEEDEDDNLEEGLPGFEEDSDDDDLEDNLPGFEEDSDDDLEDNLPGFEEDSDDEKNINRVLLDKKDETIVDVSRLLTSNKKIVSFVGTSKNGVSFLINNIATRLSEKGIKVALVDLTKNKNSYYIYTQNNEELRKNAYESFDNLKNNIDKGIVVNKNLTVYTSLPNMQNIDDNIGDILTTLIKNYTLILLDCDFSTNKEYFRNAQEIYLVQSMDVLTIQPLTEFLRKLKINDVLDVEKLRVIINKTQKVKGLTENMIVGGMSTYNDPEMSLQDRIFSSKKIDCTFIPFDIDAYSNYLSQIANCDMSAKGYNKNFNISINKLADKIFPVIVNESKKRGKR